MKKVSVLLLLGVVTAAMPLKADDKWNISKLNVGKLPPAADKKELSYDKDIKPLFKASCTGCHGDERQKGDLRLDSLDAVLKGGKAGKILVSGDSAKSLLILAIAQQDDPTAMPPKRRPGRGGPPGAPPSGGADNSPGGPGRGPGGPDGQGVPNNSGNGSFGGPPGGAGRGPQAKPLTTEQVALVRAWIDQGAK